MHTKAYSLSDMEYLKPHDRVDIIAPASRCDKEELTNVKAFLASWQLESHIPDDLFGEDLFSANTNTARLKHFENALNSNSKIIWCLRGGYGSMKLIPELSKMPPPKKPKLFIGSSDITALHIFLQNAWGWPTIHGPSAAGIGKISLDSIDILNKILFQKTDAVTFNQIKPLNTFAKKTAVLAAPIIGGNLSLIQASLGTAWQINAKQKILLIEEVNERAYRIDRMLEQLKQAKIIDQADAILFGDLIGGNEPNGSSLVHEAINRFADDCQKPVLQINGVGHGDTNNPILLGCPAELNMTADHGTLTFKLPARLV